jgi:hypothetical protein
VKFAENDHVIDAFAPDRADQPFGKPVLPGRSMQPVNCFGQPMLDAQGHITRMTPEMSEPPSHAWNDGGRRMGASTGNRVGAITSSSANAVLLREPLLIQVNHAQCSYQLHTNRVGDGDMCPAGHGVSL